MSTHTATKSITKTDIKEPSLYKVIYVNDDTTTMDFVIESLMTIFGYDHEKAVDITMEIHNEGSAVVAVLSYELAEQKGLEVTVMARSNGYPLVVRVEEDS